MGYIYNVISKTTQIKEKQLFYNSFLLELL